MPPFLQWQTGSDSESGGVESGTVAKKHNAKIARAVWGDTSFNGPLKSDILYIHYKGYMQVRCQ